VPKAMGQGGKKQKTDRRDSCQLTDDLDRYLRGKPYVDAHGQPPDRRRRVLA
jgi:hypothetical protein